MVVTTFQGTVQNGQVRLADDVILPDNLPYAAEQSASPPAATRRTEVLRSLPAATVLADRTSL